jgi:serine/threonine-protein kinase HipA
VEPARRTLVAARSAVEVRAREAAHRLARGARLGSNNAHHQARYRAPPPPVSRGARHDARGQRARTRRRRTEFTRFGDGEPAIVIERYDRVVLDDGGVLRLHQEDFCSASGRLPSKKYEAHGGPGLADLVRIVEQNSRGAAGSLAALGNFAAVNYVVGAPDGHSKNVSLLLLPNEIKVAPLYDLATSLPYDGDQGLREVAVGIGGRRKFGQVLGRHWDRAARVLGIPAEQYRRTVREMAGRFPDAFSDALTKVGTPEAEEVRRRSIDSVARHTRQLAERLDDPMEH